MVWLALSIYRPNMLSRPIFELHSLLYITGVFRWIKQLGQILIFVTFKLSIKSTDNINDITCIDLLFQALTSVKCTGCSNVSSMSGHCLRRLPNINPTTLELFFGVVRALQTVGQHWTDVESVSRCALSRCALLGCAARHCRLVKYIVDIIIWIKEYIRVLVLVWMYC